MAFKLYVWQSPRGAWLAQCLDLQLGGSGRTRGGAIREARSEADREAEMILGAEVEVVDGRPPAEDDA